MFILLQFVCLFVGVGIVGVTDVASTIFFDGSFLTAENVAEKTFLAYMLTNLCLSFLFWREVNII
jgi:hypothetical protein